MAIDRGDAPRLLDMAGVSNPGQSQFRVDCPYCGKKRRLSINLAKGIGVFHCWTPACIANEGGSLLDLLALAEFGEPKFNALAKDQKRDILSRFDSDDRPKPSRNKTAVIADDRPVIADDIVLDRVYSGLLARLPLTREDFDELVDRGLSEQAVRRNRYRSLTLGSRVKGLDEYVSLCQQDWRALLASVGLFPAEKSLKCVALGLRLARELIEMDGVRPEDLSRVPGFYSFHGKPCLRVITGMLIPVRSASGLVVGLSVHDRRRQAKYMSLSSNGMPGGIAAVARTHVPLESVSIGTNATNGCLMVTEGILKADVAAFLMGPQMKAPIVGVPGVDCVKDLPHVIRALNAKVLIDVFDADRFLNPGVAKGSHNLAEIAARNNCQYRELDWDKEGAYAKLRELIKIARTIDGFQLPDSVRNVLAAKVKPSRPWDLVRELAFDLWPRRKELPEGTFHWRDETKGIDDALLSWSKVCERDFILF